MAPWKKKALLATGLITPTAQTAQTVDPRTTVSPTTEVTQTQTQTQPVTTETTAVQAPADTGQTATMNQLPYGTALKLARDFGVACDGVTNDTAALQAALNSLQANEALELPVGTCLTSDVLRLYGKSNVVVLGAGREETVIRALNPLKSSFVVSNSSQVTIQGLQVYSPASSYRTADANSRGFYVERSSGITLDRVKARRPSGAGIVFHIVQDSRILSSEVAASWADAFHITGASQNILVQRSAAWGPGDDCFASIGYGTNLNRNIQFLDNECADNAASGVSFEGTVGGQASRNYLTRTGVAAIRIASQNVWSTGTVSDIDLQPGVGLPPSIVEVALDRPRSDVKLATDFLCQQAAGSQ